MTAVQCDSYCMKVKSSPIASLCRECTRQHVLRSSEATFKHFSLPGVAFTLGGLMQGSNTYCRGRLM